MTAKNIVLVVTALLFAVPAFADDATPDNPGLRFTFGKVADGYVRLDRQTGEVALCNQRAVGWACQAAPEDRAVLENEIVRLRSENAALKQDLLAAGRPLPSGVMPEPPAAGGNEVILRLPSDAEVDRAMAYAGRLWNQFIDALARAEKQMLNKS